MTPEVEIAQLKLDIQALRDRDAQLTVAFEQAFDRIADVPGGKQALALAKAYTDQKVAAIPASSGESTVQLPGLGKGITMRDLRAPGSAGAILFASDEDAFRLLTNHVAQWPLPPGGNHVIKHLAVTRLESENWGKWSMGYEKRADVADGPFDANEGKDFVYDIGGQATECGPRGPYSKLHGGIVGRGVKIGAVDSGGIPNSPARFAVWIDADGNPNPVRLIVEGTPQRVVTKIVSGIKVLAPE